MTTHEPNQEPGIENKNGGTAAESKSARATPGSSGPEGKSARPFESKDSGPPRTRSTGQTEGKSTGAAGARSTATAGYSARTAEGKPAWAAEDKVPEPSEGESTRAIEQVTARAPSQMWLWAAGAGIAGSLALFLTGRREAGIFVGLWPLTFLVLGNYNKIVKSIGSR